MPLKTNTCNPPTPKISNYLTLKMSYLPVMGENTLVKLFINSLPIWGWCFYTPLRVVYFYKLTPIYWSGVFYDPWYLTPPGINNGHALWLCLMGICLMGIGAEPNGLIMCSRWPSRRNNDSQTVDNHHVNLPQAGYLSTAENIIISENGRGVN